MRTSRIQRGARALRRITVQARPSQRRSAPLPPTMKALAEEAA